MTTPPRRRGVTCETELAALVRYARHLEANETVHKAREGVSDLEIVAARRKVREDFGVVDVMARSRWREVGTEPGGQHDI